MNLIVILGIIVFVAVIVFFYILDLKERLRASEIYGKKNYLRLMTQILMRFRRDITDSTDMIVRNYE